MKYTEEQAKEVLNDFKKCVGEDCQDAVETWLKTNFILPKKGLVVHESGTIAMREGESIGYGFHCNDGYQNLKHEEGKKTWTFDEYEDEWRPATKEDKKRWEELLIEEAKRRGYDKVVKFKHNAEAHSILKDEIQTIKTNKINIINNGTVIEADGWEIFNNGKWAEIISQEPTQEEINKVLDHFETKGFAMYKTEDVEKKYAIAEAAEELVKQINK